MSWKANRIADTIGHRIEFALHCGCTSLKVARPKFMLERLGPSATIEDAERRLICRKCKARPRVTMSLEWAVSGGRDTRVDPAPLPGWVREGLGS